MVNFTLQIKYNVPNRGCVTHILFHPVAWHSHFRRSIDVTSGPIFLYPIISTISSRRLRNVPSLRCPAAVNKMFALGIWLTTFAANVIFRRQHTRHERRFCQMLEADNCLSPRSNMLAQTTDDESSTKSPLSVRCDSDLQPLRDTDPALIRKQPLSIELTG